MDAFQHLLMVEVNMNAKLMIFFLEVNTLLWSFLRLNLNYNIGRKHRYVI